MASSLAPRITSTSWTCEGNGLNLKKEGHMADRDRDAEPRQGLLCHSTALEPCSCSVGPHDRSQMVRSISRVRYRRSQGGGTCEGTEAGTEGRICLSGLLQEGEEVGDSGCWTLVVLCKVQCSLYLAITTVLGSPCSSFLQQAPHFIVCTPFSCVS